MILETTNSANILSVQLGHVSSAFYLDSTTAAPLRPPKGSGFSRFRLAMLGVSQPHL
jgi:hypothetical protein